MKILRLIYDWPPPWDGLAPGPYELTNAQVKLGHTVTVFCGRWPKAGSVETPVGVSVYPFFRAPFQGTMMLTTAVLMFFKYIFWRDDDENHVDIIHSHGHFGIWIYLHRFILSKIFPWARELKTPLVVHFHNTVAGRWKAAKDKDIDIKPVSKYLDWPLAKLSDKLAVKVASACIFAGQDNLEDAINYYKADRSKCFLVESGVNTGMFKPIGQEEFEKTRRDLNLDLYDKVVLNNGAMVERKNIHLLVEALKFLPKEYKLMLVGPGDVLYLQKITDSIEVSKLKDRVIRVGYTPYKEIPVAFQAANIFVLPSGFEGFPKVVTQSLACGVPALVSGFKAKDPIKGLYYLEKLEPEYIAQRIREIVEGPREVDVGYIHEKFSWDMRARQLEVVYQKVLTKA
ncbi:MAG: glycosyl transferase group 1 [uncultured bacterium]|nr:MAG: glycosyl transferase group 1 [uncultured bacterium]